MSARRDHHGTGWSEADPVEREEHSPVSSEWAREEALRATAAAVKASKDARKKPAGESES